MEILSDEELERPIDVADDDAPAEPAPESLHVPGYRLIRTIGSGGQGSVYEAVQQRTGRRVAVKVLSPDRTGEAQKSRFQREAEMLARLDHPGIVTILDRGQTAGNAFFFVMDFVDGMGLDEYVEKLRRLGQRQFLPSLLRLFIRIGEAVTAAHREGILHRDLKPANIRVRPDGFPRVLDFGLARPMHDADNEAAARITCTGQLVGSLAWSSPEQIELEQHEIDERSDVYALGLMLYSAVTGRMPYRTAGPAALVMKAITDEAPQPLAAGWLPSRTALHVEAVLKRALAKDRDQRYLSVDALTTDLQRLLSGSAPAAAQRSRRLSSRWLPIACSAILIVGLPVLLVYPGRSPSNHQLPMPTRQNDVGMELVRVGGGHFVMGSPEHEAGRSPTERQTHVFVPGPFWIASTEVTRAQYATVMGAAPPAPGADPNLPVTNISWDQAVEFCQRLSQREGIPYRLPTEAEWELACRAGSDSAFFANADDIAWHAANSDRILRPVGTRVPNAWGLYDMHGNAAEWCWDLYASHYGTAEPAADFRAVRGGSARQDPADCRAAARKPHPTGPSPFVGFRVVQSAHTPAPGHTSK